MPLPHEPGPHWGEVGIHGLHRQRDWDAVAVLTTRTATEGPLGFVLLTGGVIVSDGDATFVEALAGAVALEPPYSAEAVRRPDGRWAVGARRILVVELDPDPGGDEIDLVWDGTARTVRINGSPTFAGVPGLERLGAARGTAYFVHATRLVGSYWEVELATL